MYSVLSTTLIISMELTYLKKGVRLLSGAFFVLLLNACAGTPQTNRLSNEPPADIPSRHELTEVAFFPQEKYQCGPAALATVLNRQHIAVTPDELVDKVYIPARKGSLQIEMIATARSYDLLTYKLASNLGDILREVASGRPVLVFQNLALEWVPQWHYAVVVGYDLNQQQLILRSGTSKRHLIPFSTFERTWQRADHWAYVLVPPDEVPVTANVVEYSRSAVALMQSGREKAAMQAFKTASDYWPDQALPQMTLGNALYAMEDFEAAQAALTRAVTNEPDNAQAWNNLAYVLTARQCRVAAIKAIGCAVRLDPDDQNLADSLKEIVGQRDMPAGQCDVPKCPLYQ
ncbi:MAG: tetratricopeptide repeat protein [Methylophaga sp.]|jgi:tetratricopeptide (TPR) repeat protein|nr:tetratricopeptide repeat protein [Methylophaga sp.]